MAIDNESGETTISGPETPAPHLVHLNGAGAVTVLGEATARPAFCFNATILGIGDDGTLAVEGGGEVVGRLDQVAGGPRGVVTGSSGDSGVLFVDDTEDGHRLEAVWAASTAVRQYSWSPPGLLQRVLAAVDGDKIYVAYATTPDVSGKPTAQVFVIR